jgi:hypothetical protein
MNVKRSGLNDMAAGGVIASLMVLIIIIVGAISFIMITNAFNVQYDAAINDSVNNSGIMLNNSSAYESTKVISTGIIDSIPAAILLAFLLAAILIVMLVWAILKQN